MQTSTAQLTVTEQSVRRSYVASVDAMRSAIRDDRLQDAIQIGRRLLRRAADRWRNHPECNAISPALVALVESAHDSTVFRAIAEGIELESLS